MPVIPPTHRRLPSSTGNPLANPVSGCEANDQSDYIGGHWRTPSLPPQPLLLQVNVHLAPESDRSAALPRTRYGISRHRTYL